MKKLAFTLSAISLLAISGVVFAQTAANRAVARDQVIDRCNAIEVNISRRTVNFNNNKIRHVEQYNKTRAKIAELIESLAAKGYDVAKLRTDLATMDADIARFSADYKIYIDDLTQTKSFACDKSAVEFKAQLQLAREALEKVHQDAVEIRTFWAKTVKPDILALKSQTPKTTTTSPTTGSTSTSGSTETENTTTGGQ